MAALVAAEPDLLAIDRSERARGSDPRELLDEVDVPAWVTFRRRDGGHLSDGTPIEDAVHAVTRAAAGA